MGVHLVVVRAFAAYAKGDTITDPTAMSQILASEFAVNVVRVVTQGS